MDKENNIPDMPITKDIERMLLQISTTAIEIHISLQMWVIMALSQRKKAKCVLSHGIEPRLSLLENNMHPTTLRCVTL